MNKLEIKRLQKLAETYDYSRRVCDPIDFAHRQQKLLYGIAEYLIQPLEDIDTFEKTEDSEGNEITTPKN